MFRIGFDRALQSIAQTPTTNLPFSRGGIGSFLSGEVKGDDIVIAIIWR
jgi:hypothetical protein